MSIGPEDRNVDTGGLGTSSEGSQDARHTSSILVNAENISKIAESVLGSQDNAISWLHAPNYSLGMRKPITLLSTETGTSHVLSVLYSIEYGGAV